MGSRALATVGVLLLPVGLRAEVAAPLGPPPPGTQVEVAADPPPTPTAPTPAAEPITPSATADTAAMTLFDCVAEALVHNPELGVTREAIQKALGQRRAANGALLPPLDFTYVEIWQQQKKSALGGGAASTITPGNMRTFTLSSEWVVFAGGALRANQAIARISQAAAEHQHRAALNNLVAQVVSSYLGLLKASEMKGVTDRTVELASQQVKVAGDLFTAGAAPKVNVLRAEAARQNALQAQLQAANGIDLAAAALNAAMGRSQLQPVRITPLPRQLADPPDLLESLRQAVAQRPELRAIQKSIQINEEAVRAARAGYYPTVALNSEVSKTMGVGQFGSSDNFKVLGVFSLNLWNWRQTDGQVRAAAADAQAQRHRLEQTMHGIELQVRQAVLNIGTARKRVEAAQAEVEAARQALQIEDLRFSTGEGTYLELLDARRSVTEAEANLVTGYYDNSLAEADWLAATGGFLGEGTVQLPQQQSAPLPAGHESRGKEYDDLLKEYGVAQPTAGDR